MTFDGALISFSGAVNCLLGFLKNTIRRIDLFNLCKCNLFSERKYVCVCERERERQTDRQADRQIDRDREIGRLAETERHTGRQRQRQGETKRDR